MKTTIAFVLTILALIACVPESQPDIDAGYRPDVIGYDVPQRRVFVAATWPAKYAFYVRQGVARAGYVEADNAREADISVWPATVENCAEPVGSFTDTVYLDGRCYDNPEEIVGVIAERLRAMP